MVGPILVGQVLGRFWSGRAEVAQIPDRLHAEGPFRLLRCCRRRRSRCRGCRGSVRRGTVAYPAEFVSVTVFARGVFFLSSHPDFRGVEGESLRTPRHAVEMPLFATNPFDQDVGKCSCRSLPTGLRTASTLCSLSAYVLDPRARAKLFPFPGAPSLRIWRRLRACCILRKK